MKTYGELQLAVASPAQIFREPIELDDVKDYLRIGYDREDDLIRRFIAAARSEAEIQQHKDLIVKQWDLTLDLLLGYDSIAGAAYPLRFNSVWNFGPDYGIDLRYPLRSVDVFQTTDFNGVVATLQEGISADYRIDTHRARVLPPYGKIWPFYQPDVSSSVFIRYTSGYASQDPYWQNDGQRVLIGMLMLIRFWFVNRAGFDPTLRGAVAEYPYGISEMLSTGARPRVH